MYNGSAVGKDGHGSPLLRKPDQEWGFDDFSKLSQTASYLAELQSNPCRNLNLNSILSAHHLRVCAVLSLQKRELLLAATWACWGLVQAYISHVSHPKVKDG
jgi:hypothetical protein